MAWWSRCVTPTNVSACTERGLIVFVKLPEIVSQFSRRPNLIFDPTNDTDDSTTLHGSCLQQHNNLEIDENLVTASQYD